MRPISNLRSSCSVIRQSKYGLPLILRHMGTCVSHSFCDSSKHMARGYALNVVCVPEIAVDMDGLARTVENRSKNKFTRFFEENGQHSCGRLGPLVSLECGDGQALNVISG